MTKTYCDFCGKFIPNAKISNYWFIPTWRNSSIIQDKIELASVETCLCDECANNIAILINVYKINKQNE